MGISFEKGDDKDALLKKIARHDSSQLASQSRLPTSGDVDSIISGFTTGVTGTTPSPKTLTGSSLPSPKLISRALISDARQLVDRVRTGKGFTNPSKRNLANERRWEKAMCYRNAMPLSSCSCVFHVFFPGLSIIICRVCPVLGW
jgi:hypothetical protein